MEENKMNEFSAEYIWLFYVIKVQSLTNLTQRHLRQKC